MVTIEPHIGALNPFIHAVYQKNIISSKNNEEFNNFTNYLLDFVDYTNSCPNNFVQQVRNNK